MASPGHARSRPSNGQASDQAPRAPEPRAGAIALVVTRREYPAVEVVQSLVASGYAVIERPWSGSVDLAAELRPDLIVVVASPSNAVDLEVIRELSQSCDAFVVLLAPSSDDLALGLKAGAHAVLVENAGAELITAQFAVARRFPGAGRPSRDAGARVTAGPLVMDPREHRAWYFDEPLQLSRAEFAILLYLAEHKDHLCTTGQIVAASTGERFSDRRTTMVLKSQVSRIRQRLRQIAPGYELISNIHGIGYRLDTARSDCAK